ncbi:hypothetical protein WN48_04971 [Eufriesea mexicana]|nr:hypothetical protein WN48_04971 [Eufriesea mexicana]
MTRDSRLVVLFFVLLMAYGLFVVEASRHPRENTANDARHRHRHRHESSNGRRNRHDLVLDGPRSSSWSQELDYEEDSVLAAADRENREDEQREEDDYEARSYYERSYPLRGSRIAVHGRMFESRYPTRYHRGGYRGTGWYDEDDERRRGSPRYQPGRGYRLRSDSRTSHRRLVGYSRNREAEYDSNEEEYDYEKPRVHNEDDSADGHRAWWKNGRKHRIAVSRYARKRHRSDQSEPARRFDDWRRRSNSTTESRLSSYSKTDNRRRMENSDDYDYHVDDAYDADRDDEDEESWKESEDEDEDEDEEEDEEDEELDNDFYKSEKKPPLKTYDDIIKWLTSDDPTTPRPTVKRDYRNIEVDRYTKRDGYGNFKYEPRNYTRPVIHERGKNVGSSAYVNAAASGSRQSTPRKFAENLPGKLLGSLIERKSPKNVGNLATKNKAGSSKMDDNQPKTKSLEQDYDEYVNAPDNEKEEDLAKAGVDEDTGMQADVTNSVSRYAFTHIFLHFSRLEIGLGNS